MSNIFKSRIEKTFFPDKNEKTTIKIYVFISIPLKLRYPNNKFLSFYIYVISINLCWYNANFPKSFLLIGF